MGQSSAFFFLNSGNKEAMRLEFDKSLCHCGSQLKSLSVIFCWAEQQPPVIVHWQGVGQSRDWRNPKERAGQASSVGAFIGSTIYRKKKRF